MGEEEGVLINEMKTMTTTTIIIIIIITRRRTWGKKRVCTSTR